MGIFFINFLKNKMTTLIYEISILNLARSSEITVFLLDALPNINEWIEGRACLIAYKSFSKEDPTLSRKVVFGIDVGRTSVVEFASVFTVEEYKLSDYVLSPQLNADSKYTYAPYSNGFGFCILDPKGTILANVKDEDDAIRLMLPLKRGNSKHTLEVNRDGTFEIFNTECERIATVASKGEAETLISHLNRGN